MNDDDSNGSITLPRWFLWIASAISAVFLSLAVPWAISVTEKLNSMNVEVATMRVRLESTFELKKQLVDLHRELADHKSDPTIHHAGIESVKRDLDRIRRRLDKLEDTP